MAIRITGMNSGLDSDAMVKELVKAYSKKTEKATKDKTKAEWKKDAYKDINKKIKSFYTKLSDFKFDSAYQLKKTASSDESRVSVVASGNAVKGSQTVEVKELATSGYLTSGKLTTFDDEKVTNDTTLSDLGLNVSDTFTVKKGNGEEVTFDVDKDTKISDFVKFAKSAGLNASFDENNGRLFLSSKDSGADENFTITSENGADAILGLTEAKGASKIEGKDAKIILNGAEFTSSSNTFSVNGLNITAKGLTEKDNPIQITTDTDYDKIYDSMKGLIKEYTSLINELDKLYNADSASKYTVLTSEEKEEMSDEEVEKWEGKIKDSLLRRDSSISDVANIMKNAAVSSYEVNGKKMSLANIGIESLSYFLSADNEKNALHISGDSDDEAVSGQENKLKAMLVSNQEDTIELFKQFVSEMDKSLTKLSASSSSRSFGNFYDDKNVEEDFKKKEEEVTKWEKYVQDMEDKWYAKFTQMEKAMGKLNSTQTNLASYFGQ